MQRKSGSTWTDDDDDDGSNIVYNTSFGNEVSNSSNSYKTKSKFARSSSSYQHHQKQFDGNDNQSVSSASTMMRYLGLNFTKPSIIAKDSSKSTFKVASARGPRYVKRSFKSTNLELKDSSYNRNFSKFARCRFFSNIRKQTLILVLILLVLLFSFISKYNVGRTNDVSYHHQTTNYEKNYDLIQPSNPNGLRSTSSLREDKFEPESNKNSPFKGAYYYKDESNISSEQDGQHEKKVTEENLIFPSTNNIIENTDLSSINGKPVTTIKDAPEIISESIPKYDMSSPLIDKIFAEEEDLQIFDDTVEATKKEIAIGEIPSLNEEQSGINEILETSTIKDIHHTELSETFDVEPNIKKLEQTTQQVAYVLSVFECPKYKAPDFTSNQEEEILEKIEDTAFLDAAAILRYSVHRNSIHNPQLNPPSKYSYQMVALLHPDVKDCYDQDGYSRLDALRMLGYDVRIMDIPVPAEKIQGEYLKKNIEYKMPTGARDLIRIHAFQLVEFDVVVLLDLRAFIVKPLDDLIDFFASQSIKEKDTVDNIEATMSRIEFSDTSRSSYASLSTHSINALFTRDYSSVSPDKFQVGIYPGLLVIKPSMSVFEEFVAILTEGDYRRDSGWGGSGIGDFWGDMTTRGILSYYYDVLHPEQGLEINRCRYNNMGSNPFIRVNGATICRNKNEIHPNCQDCRTRNIDKDITAFNLSACRDPWSCYHHNDSIDNLQLCRDMHSFWFKARRELEGAWTEHGGGGEFGYVPARLVGPEEQAKPEHFLGYCSGNGKDRYIPMTPPGIDHKKEGPALTTGAILNQFVGDDSTESKGIQKPRKHFDPEAVMFQFYDGHPKQNRLG